MEAEEVMVNVNSKTHGVKEAAEVVSMEEDVQKGSMKEGEKGNREEEGKVKRLREENGSGEAEGGGGGGGEGDVTATVVVSGKEDAAAIHRPKRVKANATDANGNGVKHNGPAANGSGTAARKEKEKEKKKLEWQQSEYVMLRPLKQSASVDEGGDTPVVWSRIQIASGMKLNSAADVPPTHTSAGVAPSAKKIQQSGGEKRVNGGGDTGGEGDRARNGDPGVRDDSVVVNHTEIQVSDAPATICAPNPDHVATTEDAAKDAPTGGGGGNVASSEKMDVDSDAREGKKEEDQRANGTTVTPAPSVPAPSSEPTPEMPSVPAPGTIVTSHKGYRMVRATHAIHGGAWYCEVKIVHLGKTGHCRLGFSTISGELGAPVGYDKHSYGYRDLCGTKVYKAERTTYGEDFYEGDVIGMYIDLPLLPSEVGDPNDQQQAANGTAAGEEPELVRWKGGTYIVEKTNNDETVCHEGSSIAFSRNGKSQGVAFRNVMKGSYYAAASLFTLPEQIEGASVQLNAGPNFVYDMLQPEGCGAPRALCELQDDERERIQIEREAAEKRAAEEARRLAEEARRVAEAAEAKRAAEEEARLRAEEAQRAAEAAEALRIAEEERIQRAIADAALREAQEAAARRAMDMAVVPQQTLNAVEQPATAGIPVAVGVPADTDKQPMQTEMAMAPVPAETVQPAPVEVAQPVSTEAAQPAQIEAAEPMPVEVAQPMPVEVAQPVSTEAAQPAQIEAAEPMPVEAAEPMPVEVAQPVSTEAAQPEPIETAEPMLIETGEQRGEQVNKAPDKDGEVCIAKSADGNVQAPPSEAPPSEADPEPPGK